MESAEIICNNFEMFEEELSHAVVITVATVAISLFDLMTFLQSVASLVNSVVTNTTTHYNATQ